MSFPETKYMGSKQALLPFIIPALKTVRARRVLDAFSGSGCVGYQLKREGLEVHSNDFLRFAFHFAKATIENNGTKIGESELKMLVSPSKGSENFIRKNFESLYFSDEDNEFLDHLWANIQRLKGRLQRSMALAAACRAAMKKRPRGIFTFTGRKGWDGRRDLKLTMREQFTRAVAELNAAVFSNRRDNRAFCKDVFEIDPEGYDLVYIDTPYVSPYSDCDYTRRYHFVEGFCTYWRGVKMLRHTSTRKIESYQTAFAYRSTVEEGFTRLFLHFRNSALAVSYSTNGIPSQERMKELLLEVKSRVTVYEKDHFYSFGNHRHKVGNNNNGVREYLIVAQ